MLQGMGKRQAKIGVCTDACTINKQQSACLARLVSEWAEWEREAAMEQICGDTIGGQISLMDDEVRSST